MPIEFKCVELCKNEQGNDEMSTVIRCDRDYFKSKNNEQLVKEIIFSCLKKGLWERGNANKREPDWKCDERGYECTLAADEEFVLKVKTGTYTTDEPLQEISRLILEAAQRKADKKQNKNYAEEYDATLSLCVLSFIYAPCWDNLNNQRVKECYNELEIRYIDTKVFENVYVMYPTGGQRWTLVDIKNHRIISNIIPLGIKENKDN